MKQEDHLPLYEIGPVYAGCRAPDRMDLHIIIKEICL